MKASDAVTLIRKSLKCHRFRSFSALILMILCATSILVTVSVYSGAINAFNNRLVREWREYGENLLISKHGHGAIDANSLLKTSEDLQGLGFEVEIADTKIDNAAFVLEQYELRADVVVFDKQPFSVSLGAEANSDNIADGIWVSDTVYFMLGNLNFSIGDDLDTVVVTDGVSRRFQGVLLGVVNQTGNKVWVSYGFDSAFTYQNILINVNNGSSDYRAVKKSLKKLSDYRNNTDLNISFLSGEGDRYRVFFPNIIFIPVLVALSLAYLAVTTTLSVLNRLEDERQLLLYAQLGMNRHRIGALVICEPAAIVLISCAAAGGIAALLKMPIINFMREFFLIEEVSYSLPLGLVIILIAGLAVCVINAAINLRNLCRRKQ